MTRLHRPCSWLLLLGLLMALGGHDVVLDFDDHHHHHGDATQTVAQASAARPRADLQAPQPPCCPLPPAEPAAAPAPALLTLEAEDRAERSLPPPLGPPAGPRAPPSSS